MSRWGTARAPKAGPFVLRKAFLVLGVLLLAHAAGPLRGAAQPVQQSAAVEALRQDVRARVLGRDTTLASRTQVVPNGRYDERSGVLRAAYRIDRTFPLQDASPEGAARSYLRAAAPAFGWQPEAEDLVLERITRTAYGTHVTFAQALRGVPVHNRRVKVSLNRSGEPSMAISGYAPHLARYAAGFNTQPAFSAAAARTRAAALFEAGVLATSEPERVVYPSAPPRLVWRLVVWPQGEPAEWEVLLDARTGEAISLVNQAIYDHRPGTAELLDNRKERRTSQQGTAGSVPAVRQVEGAGLVFDPDPVTTAGVTYGTPYADAEDADVFELNAERKRVPLHGITQGSDGRYRLEGPYVRIIGNGGGVGLEAYEPPAEERPDGFTYTRSNLFFEAVCAYYHLDQSQRYLQDLNVGRAVQEAPIRVNPRGFSRDVSGYFPGQNVLGFGTGGVDDAEDADVLWHEYGHALLEGSAPGLRSTAEGQALHEGWADYWAGSYSRDQIESGAVPVRDWRELFQWDGNNSDITPPWFGRVIAAEGRYPEATRCDDPGDPSQDGCDIYEDGIFWATALMEVYTELGRPVTDRLHAAALGYLSAPVTFRDAAEALIRADIDLYGGAHAGTLLNVLSDRGLVEADRYGPALTHQPLPASEDTGGETTVEVEAQAVSAPVEQVHFIYGIGTPPGDTLALSLQGAGRYATTLSLPATPDTVAYYIEAVDADGRQSRLPAGAPQTTYQFGVGPDHVPPAIAHEPIQEASLFSWPAQVVAEVHDNLGVDSVWVTYVVEDPAGAPQEEGRFALEPADNRRYRNVFPVPVGKLQHESVVRYRLHARDAARAGNEAVQPASGMYAFAVRATGMLRSYSFEGPEEEPLAPTGEWARGRPAYGLRTAHSGQYVWATAPDTAYANAGRRSTLALPPFNLQGLDAAYLVFWHWYDTEHDGTAQPDGRGALLWDGANVKVSTDGGASYEVVEPEGGYNGTIANGRQNPLGGEPGFGGYSYGWRRVILPLPPTDNVRVRFEFGTDAFEEGMTTFDRAGWYLDDVLLTSVYPEDATPPTVTLPPPALLTRSPQRRAVTVAVAVQDDVGVADAFVEYDGFERGTVRLAMNPADRHLFEGRIEPAGTPAYNDSLTYRLRLRDGAGNETVYPSTSEPPLRIRYRFTAFHDALQAAQASGLWQSAGPGWQAAGVADGQPTSSLVLALRTLPQNAETLEFAVVHRIALGEGQGANVKVSTDGGASWAVLVPQGGYPAIFSDAPDHPMNGQGAFTQEAGQPLESHFDLTPFSGETVQLRFDLGTARPLGDDEYWSVEQAGFFFATTSDHFDTPRAFQLYPAYPNPVADRTTVQYVLPDIQDVRLEVFDVLGRRVAVLVDALQEADTYAVSFDAGQLASGVYFLRLSAGGRQRAERIVVAR